MAKKTTPKKRTTTTTVEEAPTTTVDERDELDVFERARLEFSGAPSVKLTIYRYDDGATSYLKRVDYDPEAIDEEWIRKRCGAGEYQLRFSDPENIEARWSKIVSIAEDALPNQQPQGPSLGESLLMTTLQRQNEIMLQAFVAGRSGGGASAPAGNEVMVKLIEGMQAQTNTMLQTALNKPDASASFLTIFEKATQLAADSKLDAEGGWFAQVARAAREILPALAEMRSTMPTPPTVPGTTVPTLALPAPTPPTPPAKVNGGDKPPSHRFVSTGPPNPPPSEPTPPSNPPPEADEERVANDAVRQFAPEILQAIEEGAAPRNVAKEILDSVPRNYHYAFGHLEIERIIQTEPRFAQHRPFVSEVVNHLKYEDVEDDEAPEPPAAS